MTTEITESTERKTGVQPERDGMHAALTEAIIRAAIEVHRELGPGLLESAYEACLIKELADQGVRAVRQVPVPLRYKGQLVDVGYRLDVLVEDAVVVEIKSVERHEAIFEAQLLTYLRLSGKRVGLLINFNVRQLIQGVKRRVL